jgi:CelD/BcsL family acetyltransferase involved in cellulose biosynthesis
MHELELASSGLDEKQFDALPPAEFRHRLEDEFELVADTRFDALKPEWDALWRRAPREYLMQTPDWAAISVRRPPDGRPRRAMCVVGRRKGRIDALWPFVVYQNNRWRVATTIAAEWGDYTSPLVEDGPESSVRTRAIWGAARRLVRCDLFDLRYVRESSDLHRVISEDPTPKELLYPLEMYEVLLKGYATWNDYWQTIDPNSRRDLNRKRRRLQEQGQVAVQQIDDVGRGRELIDWMLHHKRIWLDHAGKEDKIRLRTNEYGDFLKAQVETFFPTGRCMMFALTLNDRVLGVDLASIDRTRFEWNVGTFDYEFRRFSPGLLLKEHQVRWAFERGLDYDMRLGGGQHKRFFSNLVEQTNTWRVANSAWGHAYVLMKRGVRRLRG